MITTAIVSRVLSRTMHTIRPSSFTKWLPHAGPSYHISHVSRDLLGHPLPRSSVNDTLNGAFIEAVSNIEYINPDPNDRTDVTEHGIIQLEAKLGYRFQTPSLLRLALTHRSASPASNNIMLAWMGDAALLLVLTETLVVPCIPDVNLKDASNLRMVLASRTNCGDAAQALGIPDSLIVGKAVKTQGGPGVQMIAEAFEAVLGAVYVDGGIDALRKVIRRCIPLPEGVEAMKETYLNEEGFSKAGTKRQMRDKGAEVVGDDQEEETLVDCL